MKKDWADVRLAIGICANQEKVDNPLMWDVMNLYKPIEHCVLHESKHVKSASLNSLYTRAKEFRADKILFLDADMTWPANTIPQLLSHDVPIVSGLYHMKIYPFAPVAGWTAKNGHRVNGNGKQWKFNYCALPENQLVEIDWCGVGCLLIDMDVFNHIKSMPFYDVWSRKRGHRSKGHDILFCDEVKKAGYKVYIDTSVDCGHRHVMAIDKLWVEAYHESGMHDVMTQKVREWSSESSYWDEIWLEHHLKKMERSQKYTLDVIESFIPNGSKVADFGCGDGNILRCLKKEKDCDVFAYDFSKESIDYVRAKHISGKVADIRTFTPDGDDHFHTVIFSHVLEHMDDEFEDRAIKVIHDMCDYQAFVVVPEEVVLYREHKRKYTEKKLRKVLENYFDVSKVYRTKRGLRPSKVCDLVAHCLKRPVESDEVKVGQNG